MIKLNPSVFSNLSIMARSGKLVFPILLTALLSSGCYTTFRMPPAAQQAVETQYRDMNGKGVADQYAGKVLLPEGARDSYDWNFYYNSAWWFDYYEYVPQNRPFGQYNTPGLITGPVSTDPGPGPHLPPPPNQPAPIPHFTPQSTGSSSGTSSTAPEPSDTRRTMQRRDNTSSSESATRDTSTSRESSSNSSSTERSSSRPSRR